MSKSSKITPARAAVLKAKTASIASQLPATRNADGSIKPRDKTNGKAPAKPVETTAAASATKPAPAATKATQAATPAVLAPVTSGNGQHPETIAQAAESGTVTRIAARISQAADKVIEGQTVKAIEPPKALKETVVEALAPAQVVDLPMRFVAAALTIAPQDDTRYYLNGVYVHQLPDLALRLVATDGHRLFVCSVQQEQEIAWARKGAILPAGELQRIVRYLGKKAPTVRVEFGAGHPVAKVQEVDGMAVFTVKPIDGEYPDYQRVVDAAAESFTAEREELSQTQIDSKYLKAAGALAAQLESRGIIPFLSAEGSKAASVFAFAEVPDALLYIMSQQARTDSLPAPTVRLFGEQAMRSMLAKLEAMVKRTRESAKAAKHDKFRVQFEQKAERLQLRVNQLRANLAPKLTGPAPVPASVPVTLPAAAAVH